MSFPSAYSLELKTDLSAKEAYDFSRTPVGSSHRLTDAKQFQCGEKCSFKLTLANFNNPDFNKTPYFTPGARNQKHDSNYCQRMIEHYHQREQEVTTENHGSFSREKNKLIIDLDLVKGSLAIVTKPRQKNENTPSSETSDTEVAHRHSHSSSTADTKTFRSHIKQLTALIRCFLEYQSGEKFTFYSKNKQEIQLERYFVNLAEATKRGINLEDVHIYYDTATVDYHLDKDNPDNSYFLIRFHHVCSIDNVNNRPTIIINETKSQHHGVGYKIKILKRAAKDGEPLKVFFFGSFIKHPNRKFINPNVSPIDILDYLVFS